ncbi:MAG: UDP-3-O-acyl-N-acetylglucosamine deacetylase, partial [Planctomycetota bacterium]
YWSGQQVDVWIHPGRVDTGIQLVRTDLDSSEPCPAVASHRHDHQLRTVLKNRAGDVQFSMVEHVLAALYALEIDNCIVEINGEEFPGLDGSSAAYVDALRDAGMVMQAGSRPQLVVDRIIRVGNADSWVEASPSTDGQCHYEYQLDYGAGPIGRQTFACRLTPETFCREIATARTFITDQQATALLEAGVGGHVSPTDLLWFTDQGLRENTLRFDNECARHKTLDLIGDLALTGAELVGRFVSHRGGHNLNGQLATRLIAAAEASLQLSTRRAA